MKNLELDPNLLIKSGKNIKIEEGTINDIKINFPWKSLGSKVPVTFLRGVGLNCS